MGLGYVGLPLAVAMVSRFNVIGFDICERRVGDLNQGKDTTLEVSDLKIKKAGSNLPLKLMC